MAEEEKKVAKEALGPFGGQRRGPEKELVIQITGLGWRLSLPLFFCSPPPICGEYLRNNRFALVST